MMEKIVPDVSQPSGCEALQAGSTQFFKSHYKANVMHRHARFIYIYRDARDVAVSFYESRHWSEEKRFAETEWKEFFEHFLSGELLFGAWDEHVKHWLFYETRPHLISLSYEQLIKDTAKELKKIAQFCDIPYTVRLIEKAVRESEYSVLKRRAEEEEGEHQLLGKNAQTGNWHNHFDEEDEERLWNKFGETMSWLGYER